MKSLLLMRHAKASPSDAGVADVDRSLVDEGRIAAKRIGKFLQTEKLTLDTVLSSSATRARETAAAVLLAAGITLEVRFDQRLYEAGPLRLLEVISELNDDINTVLLVGHNPALEDLLQILTGRAEHMSPGTIARVDLKDSTWSQAVKENGTLEWIVRPKELPDDSNTGARAK